MVRTRLTSLLLAGGLTLSAGCQTSLSDRPMFQRLFGNRCCEDACCPEEGGGEVIYDGPALPEGGPILPGGTLTPPTPLSSPPPPTATPAPLRPQAQPQPYTPSQVRRN